MIYVTSDLHGCELRELEQLLSMAGFSEEDFLFILGDVIDRGEHGAELLVWLSQQPNVELILGNHEAMLLSCAFLFDEVNDQSLSGLNSHSMSLYRTWKMNGGGPTIWGLRTLQQDDPELFAGILEDLRDAPLYEEVEAGGRRFVLVHAGLEHFHPDRPLDAYLPDELLWTRPALEERYFDDATVIFGHTPTELYGKEYEGQAIVTPTWICIDTGSGMGGSPMLLRLDDLREFYLP